MSILPPAALDSICIAQTSPSLASKSLPLLIQTSHNSFNRSFIGAVGACIDKIAALSWVCALLAFSPVVVSAAVLAISSFSGIFASAAAPATVPKDCANSDILVFPDFTVKKTVSNTDSASSHFNQKAFIEDVTISTASPVVPSPATANFDDLCKTSIELAASIPADLTL